MINLELTCAADRTTTIVRSENFAMTDSFIDVEMNGYSIRARFDEAGREVGYDDDIELEIRADREGYSYKMNMSQALELSKQLQSSVQQMKRAQQANAGDAAARRP